MKLGENLTGDQTTALAKKHISNADLKRAFKDPIFREFARICLLFQTTAVMVPNQKQEFGHCFIMKDITKNKMVNVEFNVIVSSMDIDIKKSEA